MGGSVTGIPFAVAIRVKRWNQVTPALSLAELALQIPRLPPSEIAAAVGLAAVRRALEQMLAEEGLTT